MARRSKSDSAVLGIFYLIGLPFIAVYGIICGIIWLIGKIILLFTNFKTEICENKPTQQKIELDKNIGITEPYCPYCSKELKKFPGRKTKCKNCGNFIYVRTRPADNKRILIKEDEIEAVAKEHYKKYGNNSLVIDATNDMKKVQKILTQNYQDFITYPAIQQISDSDKLPLMQYIWEHWDIRIDFKKLYSMYPKYSQEILDRIEKVESARCDLYYKKQEFWNEYIENNTRLLIGVHPVGGSGKQYYCLLQNMINVFEYYIKYTENYEFSHFPTYIAHWGYISEDKEIYFFVENKFVKIDKTTLLKLCQDARVKNVS